MGPRRQGKRNGEGQGLVEFVLIVPVLLVIFMGLLDLGRLYYAYVAVTDAAGEGAAYAAIDPPDDAGDSAGIAGIIDRVQHSSHGMVEIDPSQIVVDLPPTVALGAPITVTVGYSFTVMTPLLHAMVPEGVLLLRAVASEAVMSGAF